MQVEAAASQLRVSFTLIGDGSDHRFQRYYVVAASISLMKY